MRISVLIFFLAFRVYSNAFELKNGDLIFQESCAGSVGNAIKEVTSSVGKNKFTHVGIVYIDDQEGAFVIEATHPCVSVTPLSEYLYPDDSKGCFPKSVVGRLKNEYTHCISQAITEALALVGKQYDDAYMLNNDKYYCSELIYDILLKANESKPVFELNVMTFKSSETGEYADGWIKHFAALGIPIPEGELGINPGAMSCSDVIEIIHYF